MCCRGTPFTAAPEQVRGVLHTQSDLWGLGMAIWAAFFGTELHESKTEAELDRLAKVWTVPAALLAQLTPVLSG